MELKTVRRYLDLLAHFETSEAAFTDILHADFEQTEFPNALNKKGQQCGRAEVLKRMAMDAGPLKKGQRLAAHFCMIFEFKEGLIHRQRNYDCFEPF